MPIVLDTHAWVWWVTEDARLSAKAARVIREAVAGEGVSLSMISVWEIAKKAEKQQLVFDRSTRDWIAQALDVPGLRLVEPTPAILLDSCELPQPFHGDPADQIHRRVGPPPRRHAGDTGHQAAALRYVPTVW
ncbi:MAG: type II toxin-antitoxin system VapC family toxin [Vicinamibacterales bacterium]